MTDSREFRITEDMVGRFARRDGAMIADNAVVVGDVSLGEDASVWFGVTIRGDDSSISIGPRTNVQDNTCIHVDVDAPLRIGEGVTIAHGVVVHGVEVGDYTLIGMNATVLSGVRIGHHSVIGAGALVRENAEIPPRSLVVGVPARVVRTLTDEECAGLEARAAHYVRRAETYLD
ncbi:MAG: gamma carbonic anhydrase family protein [Planctomycetota bacterium]